MSVIFIEGIVSAARANDLYVAGSVSHSVPSFKKVLIEGPLFMKEYAERLRKFQLERDPSLGQVEERIAKSAGSVTEEAARVSICRTISSIAAEAARSRG